MIRSIVRVALTLTLSLLVAATVRVAPAAAETPIDPAFQEAIHKINGSWAKVKLAVGTAKAAETAELQTRAAGKVFQALLAYEDALADAKGVKGFPSPKVSDLIAAVAGFKRAGLVTASGFASSLKGANGMVKSWSGFDNPLAGLTPPPLP